MCVLGGGGGGGERDPPGGMYVNGSVHAPPGGLLVPGHRPPLLASNPLGGVLWSTQRPALVSSLIFSPCPVSDKAGPRRAADTSRPGFTVCLGDLWASCRLSWPALFAGDLWASCRLSWLALVCRGRGSLGQCRAVFGDNLLTNPLNATRYHLLSTTLCCSSVLFRRCFIM